jgi:hypothetical protein
MVLKMRRALTFSATIENDDPAHENLGRHYDSRAAHDFRGGLDRSGPDQRSADGARHELKAHWGDNTMLSVDQFLRLISVPAVIAAFLIASQISGGISRPAQEYSANE